MGKSPLGALQGAFATGAGWERQENCAPQVEALVAMETELCSLARLRAAEGNFLLPPPQFLPLLNETSRALPGSDAMILLDTLGIPQFLHFCRRATRESHDAVTPIPHPKMLTSPYLSSWQPYVQANMLFQELTSKNPPSCCYDTSAPQVREQRTIRHPLIPYLMHHLKFISTIVNVMFPPSALSLLKDLCVPFGDRETLD